MSKKKSEEKVDDPKVDNPKVDDQQLSVPQIEEEQSKDSPEVKKWLEDYQLASKNPPSKDTILMAKDEGKVRLTIDIQIGKEPYIYAHLYLPMIVGSEIKWLAQGKGDGVYGWKAILKNKSKSEVFERFGMGSNVVYVKSLKVVGPSTSGQSLLVEIAEWE